MAVSEDESERERRRQDRNLREQQRSHQINDQIAELRDLLVSDNIRFKPDKYSTLARVAQYMRELQDKQQQLQHEHEQLLATITATAQIMTQQYVGGLGGGDSQTTLGTGTVSTAGDATASSTGSSATSSTNVNSSLFQQIDYRLIFVSSQVFCAAITSIDGRFLDCNQGFQECSGFDRAELLPLQQQEQQLASSSNVGDDGVQRNLSLFNVLARQDMERVFHSMSSMLKRPVVSQPSPPALVPPHEDETSSHHHPMDTWTTHVTLCRKPSQQVRNDNNS